MWVPLIENNELDNEGADYFVKRHIDNLFKQSQHIDTIILGCTHYPLLKPLISKYLPSHVTLLTQGTIIADGLKDYLIRHPEMDALISKNQLVDFFTTDNADQFNEKASLFFGSNVVSNHLTL